MARARFIRPEFFTDEKISDLPFGACVLFAGIWCHSDLRGVFEHNPRLLRGLIFPMRDGIDTAAVGKWLDELETAGMILRFDAEGKTWGFVVNWDRHQQITGRERDIGSRRPPPPGHAQECSKHVPSMVQGQDRAASPTPTPTPTYSTSPPPVLLDTENAPAEEPAATAAPIRVPRIRGFDPKRVVDAINAGDLAGVIISLVGSLSDPIADWSRDLDGLSIHQIAVILVWRYRLRDPVRRPSGVRTARQAWRDLSQDEKVRVAVEVFGELGLQPPATWRAAS